MKRCGIALATGVILFSCNIRNHNKVNADAPYKPVVFTDSTTVVVLDSVYNFGKVTEGEKVTYNYRFKNTGTKALVISSAVATCGCTVPEKPEEPVRPGEEGFLKVVFNSEGRVGPAHKEITVVSNAYPPFPVLQLAGEVEKKP